MNKIRIAMIQALLRGTAEERREHIRALVEQAAGQGIDLVTLPEIWNGPYQKELFKYTVTSLAAVLSKLSFICLFECES